MTHPSQTLPYQISQQITASLEAKETHFKRPVKDWDLAGLECTRLYVLWQEACERRERLAWAKNDAWGELEMARAEALALNAEDRG